MAFVSSPSLRFKAPGHQLTSRRTIKRRLPAHRTISISAAEITPSVVREYERYIRDVAKTRAPAHLDGLLHVLTKVEGEEPVQPADRTGLHPFFIPLTAATKPTGDRTLTGLLRWPTPPEDMELPVVRARSDDLGLTLLASSSVCAVTRALAAADFSGRTAEAAAIRDASSLALAYQNGEADESGLGLERYLIMKTGPFPDIYEGLVNFHKAKGDEQSALITCERAATIFPGWGSGHAFHANFLKDMGRESEARDAARFALQIPLWTLGGSGIVEDMRKLAGYVEEQSLAKIFKRLYEDKREKEVEEGKLPEQVALDRAAYLLDLCVAERWEDWENAKMGLAELYDEAGMNDFATFVKY